MIPLFLELKGKKALVFGAGPVGLRKAVYLSKEAEVLMVDQVQREVPGEVKFLMGDALQHLQLIDSSDLVVAATGDRGVNDAICRRAMEMGKPYNRADGTGTFLIPSLIERRNFIVAVSTEGRSPGMSRYIRLLLERELPQALEDMVDLTERLRNELKGEVPDPSAREDIVREVLDDERLWLTIAQDREKAWQLAKRLVRD